MRAGPWRRGHTASLVESHSHGHPKAIATEAPKEEGSRKQYFDFSSSGPLACHCLPVAELEASWQRNHRKAQNVLGRQLTGGNQPDSLFRPCHSQNASKGTGYQNPFNLNPVLLIWEKLTPSYVVFNTKLQIPSFSLTGQSQSLLKDLCLPEGSLFNGS